jgi:hypothetical protein
MNDDDLKKLCKVLVETNGALRCTKESFGIVMRIEFMVGRDGELFQSTLCPTSGLSHWLDMISEQYKEMNG